MSAYNVAVARRLRGVLGVGRLARALRIVVGRHEALSIRYPERDGEPIAEVVDIAKSGVKLFVVDKSATPERDRDFAIARFIDEVASYRFSVGTLPLIRAHLLRFSADDQALVLALHHIVCDEWSVRLLLSALSAVYRSDAESLPPLAGQYFDFAARQHAWLAGPEQGRQAAYWIRHLHGAPAAFRQLDARATALAQELLLRGVQREDRVGLCLRRSPHLMAALLGVMKAEAADVPLDST